MKSVKIKYNLIRALALVLVSLPVIIFAIGWLRWYYCLLVIISSVIGLYWALYGDKKAKEDNSRDIEIKVSTLIIIAFIALVWVFLSGIGGFWAQSKDYPWRNAIYRDIVLRDWPVYYPVSNGYLVYYIGYWLPPAIFGKLGLMLGASELWAFRIGNIAQYIWASMLIVTLFFLLLSLFKANDKKKQIFLIVLFIFFSGMDILGSIEPLGANLYHLEWWAKYYQYSSFTTCLFWVFNQSIIPWICMALLLMEENVSSYVYIGMMCLFGGPFPFVGYFIYCITFGIIKLIHSIKTKTVVSFVKNVFSVSNILSAIGIFPFLGLYLLSNDAISGSGTLRIEQEGNALIGAAEGISGTAESTAMAGNSIKAYIMFICFEFLIVMLLIIRKNYKNPLYYVTMVSLLVFPFLKMGSNVDFPMRASIPALFVVYYLVAYFLISEKGYLKKYKTPDGKEPTTKEERQKADKYSLNRTLLIALIFCLILGAATPAVEIYRGCRQIVLHGWDNPLEDFLYTLGSDGPYSREGEILYLWNFGTNSPDDKVFFKYIIKK